MHSRGRLLENEGGHSLEMFVLENKLRPSSVAFSDSFPPRGSLYQRQSFKISNGLKQSVTKRAMPAPGGRLYQRQKLIFQTA